MSNKIGLHEVPPKVGGNHVAQLYRTDEELAGTVSRYIEEGLRKGDAVMVIASTDHWALFVARLVRCADIDLADAIVRGQLRILDVESALSVLMVDGMPHWDRMQDRMGLMVERARRRFGALRIYGETTNVLWLAKHRQAAERLTQHWHELALEHEFSSLRTYPVDENDPGSCHAALDFIERARLHLVPHGVYLAAEHIESELDRQVA